MAGRRLNCGRSGRRNPAIAADAAGARGRTARRRPSRFAPASAREISPGFTSRRGVAIKTWPFKGLRRLAETPPEWNVQVSGIKQLFRREYKRGSTLRAENPVGTVAKRNKIAFIGAGNVGATCAHLCFLRSLGDILLYDIIDGLPQGKALDMLESAPVLGVDVNVGGSTDIKDIAGADCIVVTSGSPRKPGMSRDDLLKINAGVMNIVGKAIKEHAPGAFVIVVTNPLDAMVTQIKRVSGLPKNRIVGQAGVLDSARYRTFLAAELNVSVDSVRAMVLGGHGDDMVPIRSYTTVGGQPVEKLIAAQRLEEIEVRTRNGGAEIVNLMKTSSYYAAGSAVYRMVEAYMLDRKEVLPAAAYLEGEYGVNGLFAGVPVVIGGGGVERIVQIDLTAAEKKAFDSSVAHVRELVEAMDKAIAG